MKKLFQIFFCLCLIITNPYSIISYGQSDNPPVGLGQWRIHLPYTTSIAIAEGNNKVFCASKYGLFSYNKNDGSIERYSRVTGLNDLEISTIRYNSAIGVLLIAYQNSNLDMLFDDN